MFNVYDLEDDLILTTDNEEYAMHIRDFWDGYILTAADETILYGG